MIEKKLLNIAEDSACFVCGQDNPIGLQANFTTDPEACSSHATVQLSVDYQGWQDVVHGGIIAALLDEACIYACRCKAERCVTAELQLRYRKPVPVGVLIEISGVLTESHRKVWQASAQLKIAGSLYAEAQAKVFIFN
ncbi:MAG: PaaI family thioesterase [Desulfuromonadales bacterium]|nr:PaaI family thioesterase [Desulfuromonadales bacterium]